MISGGAMDGAVMPVSTYKGQELIYPIGIKEYKEITGREFDINEQNKIAKMFYMGSIDNNDSLMAVDCYGDKEREILIKLWGTDPLKRRFNIIKSYKEVGAKGIFIHEQGVDHTFTGVTMDYIMEFIIQNRNSNTPVYVIPKDKTLTYDLIK